MRKHSWISRSRFTVFSIVACGLVAGATGCSPAVQPLDTVATSTGTAAPNGWKTISDSVLLGEQAQMYKVKMNVDVARGSTHSDFSVYGSINGPERALISFHENTTNMQFYQQGQSAYQQLNSGHWSQTTPVDNLDVFPSYVRLVQAAAARHVSVVQLKDMFVVDEYCNVFQATVPSSVNQSLPLWQTPVSPDNMGEVQYTFYVGKSDGQLREVTTQSVESTAQTGAFQIQSDTVLFNLNDESSKVILPKDLIGQLESPGQ